MLFRIEFEIYDISISLWSYSIIDSRYLTNDKDGEFQFHYDLILLNYGLPAFAVTIRFQFHYDLILFFSLFQ